MPPFVISCFSFIFIYLFQFVRITYLDLSNISPFSDQVSCRRYILLVNSDTHPFINYFAPIDLESFRFKITQYILSYCQFYLFYWRLLQLIRGWAKMAKFINNADTKQHFFTHQTFMRRALGPIFCPFLVGNRHSQLFINCSSSRIL